MTASLNPADITGRIEWAIAGRRDDRFQLMAALFGRETALEMTPFQCDSALADIHLACFGPRIEATHRCVACGELYDFDFAVADFVANLAGTPQPAEVVLLDAEGHAVLDSGQHVRAPRLADELDIANLEVEAAVEALARACVLEGEMPGIELLSRVLEWLSPTLDAEVEGCCPECGARDTLRFCMEHFVLAKLQRERALLLREMHLLAATYGWSMESILALPRRDRNALADLVSDDRSARRSRSLG
jgi:hypothetical protein